MDAVEPTTCFPIWQISPAKQKCLWIEQLSWRKTGIYEYGYTFHSKSLQNHQRRIRKALFFFVFYNQVNNAAMIITKISAAGFINP